MSLTFDEYGRPFIIIREQGQKMRLKGRDAQKVAFVNNSPLYNMRAIDHYHSKLSNNCSPTFLRRAL